MVEQTAEVETTEIHEETYYQCDACGREVEDNTRYIPVNRESVSERGTITRAEVVDRPIIDLCEECRGTNPVLDEDRLADPEIDHTLLGFIIVLAVIGLSLAVTYPRYGVIIWVILFIAMINRDRIGG